MKTIYLLLVSVILGGTLQAQTNVPETNTALVMPETTLRSTNSAAVTNRIEIFSDSGQVLTESNIVIYTGTVRAFYNDSKLTCDVLTLHMPKDPPKGAERPDYVIAERNVVIDDIDKDGHPIHATGDRAVYTYKVEDGKTNEIVVLTGSDAKVESTTRGLVSAEQFTWDRVTGNISWTRQHTIFDPKDAGLGKSPFGNSRTNAP